MDKRELKKIKSRKELAEKLGTPMSPNIRAVRFFSLLANSKNQEQNFCEIKPEVKIEIEGYTIGVLGFYEDYDDMTLDVIYQLPNNKIYRLCVDDAATGCLSIQCSRYGKIKMKKRMDSLVHILDERDISIPQLLVELYKENDFLEHMPTGHKEKLKELLDLGNGYKPPNTNNVRTLSKRFSLYESGP